MEERCPDSGLTSEKDDDLRPWPGMTLKLHVCKSRSRLSSSLLLSTYVLLSTTMFRFQFCQNMMIDNYKVNRTDLSTCSSSPMISNWCRSRQFDQVRWSVSKSGCGVERYWVSGIVWHTQTLSSQTHSSMTVLYVFDDATKATDPTTMDALCQSSWHAKLACSLPGGLVRRWRYW